MGTGVLAKIHKKKQAGLMGRSAVSAAILACLAFAAPVRADDVIIPGKSIGPVLIGMTAQELYRAMGEPRSSDVGEDKTSYTYDGLQVGVENDSQRVYRAFATSPRYKLVKGIAVGSSALAAVAAYGEPDERDETPKGDKTFCYDDFELYIRDGAVAAIMVSKESCDTGFFYFFR
jgi:hypothetical protein